MIGSGMGWTDNSKDLANQPMVLPAPVLSELGQSIVELGRWNFVIPHGVGFPPKLEDRTR